MIEESRDEREKRIKTLWENLDTRKEGDLDFKGFQKGLKKIDHRKLFGLPPGSSLSSEFYLLTVYSS